MYMAIHNFSFVIASNLPHKLAEFYVSASYGELIHGYSSNDCCILLPQGLKIYIYKPSSSSKALKRDSFTALCLTSEAKHKPLDYLSSWISTLVLKGASISVHPRLESFGAEAWLKDPEQNRFLLFVPLIKGDYDSISS